MAAGASEVDTLQMQANQVTDESVECTRRMLQMAEESEDVGMKTLTMLNDQGEQLHTVNKNMDTIQFDMQETKKNLTGMEKWCGICICPCGKSSKSRNDNTWLNSEDGRVVSTQLQSVVDSTQPRRVVDSTQPQRVVDNRNGAGPVTGGFVQRITNDAREDEMDENVQQVSSIVGNLRNMAIDMGNEIGSHNKQLETINQKAQTNEAHILNVNKRTAKLLQK